jgi:uncharacterized protein (TIGR01244 family)
MQARDVTPEIVVADQPDLDDLDRLSAAGIRGVVNLRLAGEPEQPLDPAREGEEVRARGLGYLHRPVGGAPLTSDVVGDVAQFIEESSTDGGRVLVHCRKGGRAVALALLALAKSRNWQPSEALERGRALGLTVDGNLRLMVEDYLRRSEADRTA